MSVRINNNQKISSDIFEFATILMNSGLIDDAKSLYEASERIRTSRNSSIWSYECNNLKFVAHGKISGTIPQNIGMVEIVLNISIQGQNDEIDDNMNPLSFLTFDIEIEGMDHDANTYHATWHLDKNIREDGDNQSEYVHPEYHFTFGGNKMEDKGNIFGSTLILPAPRIAYPPMDVILGIDFILQNYFPYSFISKALQDSKYKEIVKNSQLRLWRNYYLSISSAWKSKPKEVFQKGFESFDLNPHIILDEFS